MAQATPAKRLRIAKQGLKKVMASGNDNKIKRFSEKVSYLESLDKQFPNAKFQGGAKVEAHEGGWKV